MTDEADPIYAVLETRERRSLIAGELSVMWGGLNPRAFDNKGQAVEFAKSLVADGATKARVVRIVPDAVFERGWSVQPAKHDEFSGNEQPQQAARRRQSLNQSRNQY